ncbi:hypothetical protein LTR95_011246 [Oleoguttula sp. CCFEE 5521]
MAPHSYPAHPSDAVRDRTITESMTNVQEQATDEGFEQYLRHTANMPALPMLRLTRQGLMEADIMFRRGEKDSAVAVTGQGLKRKASDVIDLTETDGSGDQGRGWSALGSKRMRMEDPIDGLTEVEPTNAAKVDDFIALMGREVIDLTSDELAIEATLSIPSGPMDPTDEDEDLYNVTPEFAHAKHPSVIPLLTLPAPQISVTPETPAPRPKKTPIPRLKKSWMGALTQLDLQMGVKAAPAPAAASASAATPVANASAEEDLSGLDPELVAEMQAALEEPEEGAVATPLATEAVSTIEALVMAEMHASQQGSQKTEKKRNKTKSKEISPEMQAHLDSAVAYQDWFYANQRGVEVGPEPVILPNPELGAPIGGRAKPIKGTKRGRED